MPKTLTTTTRSRFLSPLLLALMLAVAACSSSADTTENEAAAAEPVAAAPTAVTKTIFGMHVPKTAKGQDLYLYEVVVPVGAEIAAHTHPGMQIAHIQEGTLTYDILDGTAIIIRHAGTPEETQEDATSEVVTLATGDGVIEQPGMVHQASNQGDVPVRIVLSSLFPVGAEMSSPAPVPAAAATP